GQREKRRRLVEVTRYPSTLLPLQRQRDTCLSDLVDASALVELGSTRRILGAATPAVEGFSEKIAGARLAQLTAPLERLNGERRVTRLGWTVLAELALSVTAVGAPESAGAVEGLHRGTDILADPDAGEQHHAATHTAGCVALRAGAVVDLGTATKLRRH